MEPRRFITALGPQCEPYPSRVTFRCPAGPRVATWVEWWRSVCLNAQRIKPSCPPRNSVSLRLSGFYACFARELADYCDYPVVRRIAVNFAKLPNLLLSGQGRES